MCTPHLAPILTDAAIDEALRRAEREVCAPGDPRCYGLPYTAEAALGSMTPDGWCRVGWVAGQAGQDDWDVWFHIDTGVVRPRRREQPPNLDAAARSAMMPRVDDDAPVECWVCGRAIAVDEPRRLVPIVPDDPRMPPVMTGIACLGCYRGREQTSVPGASAGREASRVLMVPAAEFTS
jgi:hypothetical protein